MSKKITKKLPPPEKILPIRFLLLDVDGVMTDGRIIYSESGEELKAFNVKDGSGLMYWMRAGYQAGIITGRTSPVVEKRAAELGIAHLAMGVKAKLPVFEELLSRLGLAPSEVAIMGDDLMEIPVMARAGLGIAVRDAVEETREAADWVTEKKGGKGAVREVVDHILKVQGKWDGIMERYKAN